MKIKKLEGEELGRARLRFKYVKEMKVAFSDDLLAYGDWLEQRLAALEENLTIHGVSSTVCTCGSDRYGYGFAKCFECGKIKDI